MLNFFEKQNPASIMRAEMPTRFTGILTPSEFDEMVEYGFIRQIPEDNDNPFETLTERMLPKVHRGRMCDTLNTLGCFDQPTFIRLGKKWPQLESSDSSDDSTNHVNSQSNLMV
ncbi:MAG: hypothetical protein HQL73_01945 [Magnetococcales bacterium]|nr:hypothetical protein [Magnetococcales bacterium]